MEDFSEIDSRNGRLMYSRKEMEDIFTNNVGENWDFSA